MRLSLLKFNVFKTFSSTEQKDKHLSVHLSRSELHLTKLIFRSLTWILQSQAVLVLNAVILEFGQRPLQRDFIQLPFQILSERNTTVLDCV